MALNRVVGRDEGGLERERELRAFSSKYGEKRFFFFFFFFFFKFLSYVFSKIGKN